MVPHARYRALPLAEHRLRTMARLVVEGRGAVEISKVVGCHQLTVAHYLDALAIHRGDSPPNPSGPTDNEQRFISLVEDYESRLLQTQYLHRYRLTDYLDEAYAAVGRAVRCEDRKVANEAAWRLFEAVMAPSELPATVAAPAGPAVQVNLQLNAEVARAATTLTGVVTQLEAMGSTTYERHLKTPDAATGQLVGEVRRG